MRFLADRRQHFFPADRRKSHFFGSTAASTSFWPTAGNPLIPAGRKFHLFRPTGNLYSSTACVHFYYVQALSCMHFYYFPAFFSVRISTVFRHCLTRKRTQEEHIMRAFLLHFHFISIAASAFPCANSYCIPALSACISIMFKHTVLHTVHTVLRASA